LKTKTLDSKIQINKEISSINHLERVSQLEKRVLEVAQKKDELQTLLEKHTEEKWHINR
jgi:hypothetical protein